MSSSGSLSLLEDDLLEFLPLGLSPQVGSEAVLQELKSTLLPGHLQELHCAALVGSEANNLADDVPDKFVVGCVALRRVKHYYYRCYVRY